jgi:hypothetical protein
MRRLSCAVLCAACVGMVTMVSCADAGSARGASAVRNPGAEKNGDRLLTTADIGFAGAFKLPKGSSGKGKHCNFAYATGAIAYDSDRNSFYVSGHRYLKGVAEISNPGLVNTTDMSMLPRAAYVQSFRQLMNHMPSGNPDKLGEVGGAYVEKGELLFTAYEFYDADCSAREVFGVLKGTADMGKATIVGFYETGHGAHTAGWVSPVPPEHQSALKGTHIMASGQSQSIAGRYPLRPTAFSFKGSDVFGNENIQDPLKVTRLIDGNLQNTLPGEMWNHSLDEASYGIIVPGTKTYIAFGHRGGMFCKIGYKITTDDGRHTGGYAAQDDDDHYMYYWMYNVDDMTRAARGEISPYKVYPYEHGMLPLPFLSPNNSGSIGGGTWDPKTKTVYLTLMGRERASRYTVLPIVVAVRFENLAGEDTTAPYGVMTEPNNGKKVSGTRVIEAHAVDNVDKNNALTVQFTVNGEDHGEPATKFPFRTSWDTTKLANGQYKISAVATDKAGNERRLNTVTVTVGN